jgi:Cys-rich repeat protein
MDCRAAGGGVCDTTTDTCVQCLAEGDCPTGQTCNTTAKRCAATCDAMSAMTACRTGGMGQFGGAGICDTAKGYCVQCASAMDCAGGFGATQCFTSTGQCVGCLTSNDCADPRFPNCNTTTHTCGF